jgi:hypothetical protein
MLSRRGKVSLWIYSIMRLLWEKSPCSIRLHFVLCKKSSPPQMLPRYEPHSAMNLIQRISFLSTLDGEKTEIQLLLSYHGDWCLKIATSEVVLGWLWWCETRIKNCFQHTAASSDCASCYILFTNMIGEAPPSNKSFGCFKMYSLLLWFFLSFDIPKIGGCCCWVFLMLLGGLCLHTLDSKI